MLILHSAPAKRVKIPLTGTSGFTPESGFSVSGTLEDGESIVITGTGFGTKSPAKPLIWAPMDGTHQPSALGVVTAWDEVQSMGYAAGEGYGGGGAIKATDSSGSWTAGIIVADFAWNDYNQQMYCYRRIKRNFDVDGDRNWKIIRVWPQAITTPDWFIQSGNANLNVEGVEGSDQYPYDAAITSPISGGNIAAVRGSANVWRTEEILMQSNSAANTYDAEFYHYVNGSGLVGVLPHTTYQEKNFRLRDADEATDMTLIYPVHGVKANETFPSDYRYWADDVYLDSTFSRVVIGNASTLASSNVREVQIPTAWATGEVSVNLRVGEHGSLSGKYLYVVDSDNTAIRIGQFA